ncbi:helix-turn-helix transcriptional regulator [Variovorax sp. dw_954]|uniref:helix-turn-helix domain-containing protein n=1 Tax=Variovorax sp. dw_954 TaxID=2720078 RepID=UPI001BD2E970|nr:helix-turn-helix transcriptional regulator [Variovorax sp. dw_954]
MTQNLAEIVRRAPSVADFCRRVGINRQQFNKYLAGTHLPSPRTMLKIAEICGIGAGDFMLDPSAFLERLRRGDQGDGSTASAPAQGTHFDTIEAFARNSLAGLRPFLGAYFRYHHSSIFPGKIIRAVTVIYQSADIVRYVTVEYMPESDENLSYRFSYRGVCYLMGSRIFMADYEHRQLNEMTSTILMPQFRTPIRYMFGLLTGIAANAYGQPFSTRVAFERKSDDSVIRKAMIRQASMLLPGDPQIPGNVKRYLGEASGAVLMGGE